MNGALDQDRFSERFDSDKSRYQDHRTEYERDRARILHSASFRRLQGKTQVMGAGEGDFHRSRLTHSLECAQIGSGILLQLSRSGAFAESGINEQWIPSSELIEAACLAHDIGHPPFGHGGEQALFDKMRGHGGFEGNAQTLRILTFLEQTAERGGINPTRRLILACTKYAKKYSSCGVRVDEKKPPKCIYDESESILQWALAAFDHADREAFVDVLKEEYPRTLDCSIMNLADDIAYGVHDLEDIIARGFVGTKDLSEMFDRIVRGLPDGLRVNHGLVDASTIVAKLFGSHWERKAVISSLVHIFVVGARIVQNEKFSHPLLSHSVVLPEPLKKSLDILKGQAFNLVIKKANVQQLEQRGKRVVAQLFEALLEKPEELIPHRSWSQSEGKGSVERRVCDYVAGMTDRYAERIYLRLFVPGSGSSRDEL